MLRPFQTLCGAAIALAAGCASIPISGAPAVDVFAKAETEPVGTTNADAADDPAIWRNSKNPLASLIVATDKKAGLYVYALDGSRKSFLPAGNMNNVDLVELADGSIVIAASDRTDPLLAHVLLAQLDPETATLREAGRFVVGPGEAYGLCVGKTVPDGPIEIYSPLKEGALFRTRISLKPDATRQVSEKVFDMPSQPEGCVFDARTDQLYVGEENAGIWQYDTKNGNAKLVAAIDNQQLVADVEGLALAPSGADGGYLVASSQGDNAYALYNLPDMTPAGRFAIREGAIGGAEETDGIALDVRSFGSDYPAGLFVAQDGLNGSKAQNFKLVSWADVLEALDR